MRTRTILRYFKCCQCGCVLTAPKRSPTCKGHLKTMYCFVCREDRQFEQIDTQRVK